MTTAFVTGDKKLDKALRKIGTKIAEKAIASGVRAWLGENRKHMKRATPNSSAKKTIAARFKRKKKFGRVEAKVGAGVGKHNQAHAPTGGGVGISKRNAGWYFFNRNLGITTKSANRGVMPINNSIPRGAAMAAAPAMIKLRRKTRQVLEKEAAKEGRK